MTTKFGSKEVTRKLTKGQTVYVRDDRDGWISAYVVDDCDKNSTVVVQLEDDRILQLKLDDVLARSEETDLFQCSSLTELNPINEASALECLHQRFTKDIFYTSAGTTIVAVNPFKDVPELYNIQKIRDYHISEEVLDPHIYVIAEKAYKHMVRELGKVHQSIVVSGESGAGKTVSAKYLLRYLTIVSSPEMEIDLECSIPGSVIERQVLDSNPILEAFGNAATPRNENSSRFGKFIQLQFHRNGYILGGVIQTYLLEKTRVVHQGLAENNFHIFYQSLYLRSLNNHPFFFFFNIFFIWEFFQIFPLLFLFLNIFLDETLSVLQTVEAMTDIGVPPTSQVSIFKILLAVLQLSSLRIISAKDGEASSISDDEASTWAKDVSARLLGISSQSLHDALLNRNIVSGAKSHQTVFIKPVTVAEAQSRRDTLAMLLYSRVFDWLVTFINKQIKAPYFDSSINLLDIYGFETFDVNNLEQLCINYANERLQQHYVTHFLRDLQTEYEAEHISWTPVVYKDNKICVETLDGPNGVFGLLNEEVALNRKSDDSCLCGRIVDACKTSGIVRKPHAGTYETKFYVRHYAGDVLYTVQDAVTKNKDNIPLELISLMAHSSDNFILNLFNDTEYAHTEQSLTPTKTKKKISVLTKFKSSLDSLMSSLERSDVHFIRCIKPNNFNKPAYFDRVYALQQLRACGTIETVDICRLGYPARMTYQDFVQRYGLFMKLNGSRVLSGLLKDQPLCDDEDKENGESFCEKIESQMASHDRHTHSIKYKKFRRKSDIDRPCRRCACILMKVFSTEELHNCHLQFGMFKIFLTQKQTDRLEHTRAIIIGKLVSESQAAWRGFVGRRHFSQMKAAALKIQARWRTITEMRRLNAIRCGACRIQKCWRVYKLLCRMKQVASSARIIKRTLTKWIRRQKFRKALHDLKRQRREQNLDKSLYVEDVSQSCFPDLWSDSAPCDVQFFHEQINNFEEALVTTEGDMTDNKLIGDLDDTLSICSDDSGVMIKDDLQSLTGDVTETPPMKKQKLAARRDLNIGDGIITCRRLTKPGLRFHVRKSILKYGHRVHHSELVHGMADALEQDLTDVQCPCNGYPKQHEHLQ
ncbi:unnamed protein product [Lymnaea stagnalis]|uniref:Myosin motor domain-containing protein n=1 Tax=Lymnaea stagnalis TaxID=6523 RepID=A0AAV2IFL8_LYMST